jgi:hypothetical protein
MPKTTPLGGWYFSAASSCKSPGALGNLLTTPLHYARFLPRGRVVGPEP